MILTCPSCSSRYFVAEGQVPPGGRDVRCTHCDHVWRARLEEEPLPIGEAVEALARPLPLHTEYRSRLEARRALGKRFGASGVWLSLALLAVALASGLAAYRFEVTAFWPPAERMFALVGVEVSPTGLVIDNVRADRVATAQGPALLVRADVRNITRRPRAAPLVEISLHDDFNATDRRVLVELPRASLEPGQSMTFEAQILNPPVESLTVNARFAEGEGRPAQKAGEAVR